MAPKYDINAIKRIIGLITISSGSYFASAIAYNEYHQKFGPKRRYMESPFYQDDNKQALMKMCSCRDNLVGTLRKLVEIVPVPTNTVHTIFTDNVVWKDPVTTIKGKDDLTHIFNILPKFIKEVKTTTFDVVHYEDHIRIVFVRKIKYITGSPADRESSIILNLRTEPDGEERIHELIDEWNDVPLLCRKNNILFGWPLDLIRSWRVKYALLNDKLHAKVMHFYEGNSDEENVDYEMYSKYLETPKPKYAGK